MLSLLAGLSTSIGALIVVLYGDKIENKHLAFTSGFAASVMMTISLLDMLVPSIWSIGMVWSFIAFSIGFIVFIAVQRVIESFDVHPEQFALHSSHVDSELDGMLSSGKSDTSVKDKDRLFRLGVITAVILTLHNLPEGLAVAISSIDSSQHGIVIAIAVALHNIPEGLAIATPLYASTKSIRTTMLFTTISGMSEPLGALLSLGLLKSVVNSENIHFVLSLVAGIMTAVSCIELIPEGFRYTCHRLEFFQGIASGIILMILDLFMIG